MTANKCRAGTSLPKLGPCPRCGSDNRGVCWVSINQDIADAETLRGFIKEHGATPSIVASQVERWRNRAAAAEAVLEFIAIGYANQNINHKDFRVSVYKAALETLEASTLPQAIRQTND